MALAQVEAMLTSLLSRLPAAGLGIVVLVLFYLLAKGVRALVKRYAERRDQYRSVDLRA